MENKTESRVVYQGIIEVPLAQSFQRRACRTLLRALRQDSRAAIIFTELSENEGPSITNCIEWLSRAVEADREHFGLVGASNIRVVEHYGPESYRHSQMEHTFDLVSFLNEGNVKWTRIALSGGAQCAQSLLDDIFGVAFHPSSWARGSLRA